VGLSAMRATTASILSPRRSIDLDGQEVDVATKGRHDPCVGIRAAPVAEAMLACVLADAFLQHRAQTGGGAFRPGGTVRS
jgi:chorismate synthase